MSHAGKADKLLIKPTAGARPAPPHTRRQIIRKAHTKRPVTRRVTRGTATTRLATTPDRPTRRVLPSLEPRSYSASESPSPGSMTSMTSAARCRTKNAATSSATTTSSPDDAEGASVPSLVAVSIALPGRIGILKRRPPDIVEPERHTEGEIGRAHV